MFVPITNAKEYREAETNFLSWLAENKGEEAASRAVDAEVIVQMNTLRQLAAVWESPAGRGLDEALLYGPVARCLSSHRSLNHSRN